MKKRAFKRGRGGGYFTSLRGQNEKYSEIFRLTETASESSATFGVGGVIVTAGDGPVLEKRTAMSLKYSLRLDGLSVSSRRRMSSPRCTDPSKIRDSVNRFVRSIVEGKLG